jgi:hypothetical protein
LSFGAAGGPREALVDSILHPSLGKDVAQGQHYMLIDSYESSSAVDKEGSGTRMSSIALYIPPNALKTSIGANFEGLAGGVLFATGTKDVAQTIGDMAQKVLAKAEITKNFMTASQGLAVNNHMALVYRGPGEFRTHDFVFQFFPKDKDESLVVQKIITDLKNGMTPRLSGSLKGDNQRITAPFFKSPRQYKIEFLGGTKPFTAPLFTMQTSVLTSMTVNHDPQGIVGFHEDGAPVQTTLSLNFKEIEYLLSGDSAEGIDKTIAAGKIHTNVTSTAIQGQ